MLLVLCCSEYPNTAFIVTDAPLPFSSVDGVTVTLWLNILAAIETSSIFLIIIDVGNVLLLTPKNNRLHPGYYLILSSSTGTNVLSPLILFSPENKSINTIHTPARFKLGVISL